MIFLKRFYNLILILVVTAACAIFVSCDSDVKVELNKDGSIGLQFSGEFGDGLSKLVNSISEDDEVFDTKTINYELSKSGFSDVFISAKGKRSLSIEMTERQKKSYLFTSGMLSENKNGISIKLSPETLEAFYSLCDEQIVLYLDLLLAPIFNDEIMSESEYLETIGAFYGQSVADEFKKSNVKVTVVANGKEKTSKISIAKLLTLNETIVIGF